MNNSLTSNTTLTVHSPLDNNFNTSAVNLTMSSLQMANVSKTMQDDEGYSTYEDVGPSNSVAASIIFPASGNLTEIDIYLPIATLSDVTIEIFNSTWNGYQAWINSSVGIFFTSDPVHTSWYNGVSNWATFYNNHFYLNNSKTANNTWYVACRNQ